MTTGADRTAVEQQANRLLAIDGLRPRMRAVGPSGRRYTVQPTPDAHHPLMLMSGRTMIHNPSTRFRGLSGAVHGSPRSNVDDAFMQDAAALFEDFTQQSLATRGTEWAAGARRLAVSEAREQVSTTRQQARGARTAATEPTSRGL